MPLFFLEFVPQIPDPTHGQEQFDIGPQVEDDVPGEKTDDSKADESNNSLLGVLIQFEHVHESETGPSTVLMPGPVNDGRRNCGTV